MSKSKSAFVTLLLSVMSAAIVVGSRVLFPTVFEALIRSLASIGFVCGAFWFYKWLSKPAEYSCSEDIPELVCGDPVDSAERLTYEDIKEEVLGHNA